MALAFAVTSSSVSTIFVEFKHRVSDWESLRPAGLYWPIKQLHKVKSFFQSKAMAEMCQVIYQTLKTKIYHIFKHNKENQKYDIQYSVSDALLRCLKIK